MDGEAPMMSATMGAPETFQRNLATSNRHAHPRTMLLAASIAALRTSVSARACPPASPRTVVASSQASVSGLGVHDDCNAIATEELPVELTSPGTRAGAPAADNAASAAPSAAAEAHHHEVQQHQHGHEFRGRPQERPEGIRRAADHRRQKPDWPA